MQSLRLGTLTSGHLQTTEHNPLLSIHQINKNRQSDYFLVYRENCFTQVILISRFLTTGRYVCLISEHNVLNNFQPLGSKEAQVNFQTLNHLPILNHFVSTEQQITKILIMVFCITWVLMVQLKNITSKIFHKTQTALVMMDSFPLFNIIPFLLIYHYIYGRTT